MTDLQWWRPGVHISHDGSLRHAAPAPTASVIAFDAVKAPRHYQGNGLQAIDVIEDWGLGFHLGNAVKYVLRAPHKGREQDLEKACRYLSRAAMLPATQIAMASTRDLAVVQVAMAFDLAPCAALALDEIRHAIDRPMAAERSGHLLAAIHALEADLGHRVERWER